MPSRGSWRTGVSFAGSFGADIALTMVAGSFLMFLILLLVLIVSMVVGDRRWQQRKTSFSEFLKAKVAIDSYTMRGRDVLIKTLQKAASRSPTGPPLTSSIEA